jgi:NAD-dependent SIR2 family protein deacetylase
MIVAIVFSCSRGRGVNVTLSADQLDESSNYLPGVKTRTTAAAMDVLICLGTSNQVIPAEAGIQEIIDFTGLRLSPE